MSETQMQVIVAAFRSPDTATQVLDELNQGKKASLRWLANAATIVKDADDKLKVISARGCSRRLKDFVTDGALGGLLGPLAGPVGWAAIGGGVFGALTGRLRNTPIKHTMEEIGACSRRTPRLS